MFSGIVETQSLVSEAREEAGLIRLTLQRPSTFDDIKTGDSICVNGVCLTIEAFDTHSMRFALAAETLKVTGWSPSSLRGSKLNLERSLRYGDRVHGHMVSGHVDALGEVTSVKDERGSRIIEIRSSESIAPFLWKKGSVAVNGVSLTINESDEGVISVCLIPETLERTNLGGLASGSRVNLEADMAARALVHAFRERGRI